MPSSRAAETLDQGRPLKALMELVDQLFGLASDTDTEAARNPPRANLVEFVPKPISEEERAAVILGKETPAHSLDVSQLDLSSLRGIMLAQEWRNNARLSFIKPTCALRHSPQTKLPICFLPMVIKDGDGFGIVSLSPGDGDRLREVLQKNIPGTKLKESLFLLPIHPEQARHYKDCFSDCLILQSGAFYAGSSPRSMLIGTADGDIPFAARLSDYTLKLHLDNVACKRIGGAPGDRDLERKDLERSIQTSGLLENLLEESSVLNDDASLAIRSRLDWYPEALGGLIPLTEGREIGTIFRPIYSHRSQLKNMELKLPIPGFALYSLPEVDLPIDHIEEDCRKRLPPLGDPECNKSAASEIIAYFLEKSGKEKSRDAILTALIDLFIEPMTTLFFALAKKGISYEIHAQNFLLRFDSESGSVQHIVLRDLHAIYLDPRRSPAMALFPSLSDNVRESWFYKNGKLKDRFNSETMYGHCFNVHLATFFYQLILGLGEDGTIDEKDVLPIQSKIQNQVAKSAHSFGFKLALLKLDQYKPRRLTYYPEEGYNLNTRFFVPE